MRVNGNLDFRGEGKLVRAVIAEGDFPPNPTVGEFARKDRKLYLCVGIEDGLPLWCNLVNELSLVRWDQTTPALEWTIEHSLNTNILIVQVYDDAGNQIIPDNINCAVKGRVTITFNTPTTGVASLQSGDPMGLPGANSAFTEEYSGQVWTVTHNLGYNPSITCIVGGYVVQPVSVIHNSTMQATITFSAPQTGSVRCV